MLVLPPRARLAALLAVLALGALGALGAGYHFTRLTAAQQPRTFYDTGTYFQIAERPVDLALLALAKPPTVPLVYRAADRDAATIESWQRPVSFVAWLLLALAAVAAVRHPVARGLAAVTVLAMALAPARLGWTAVSLSESLDDSLLALVVAGALAAIAAGRLPDRARAWARIALAVGLALAAVAWVFARDTNALAVIVVIVAGAWIGWPRLRAREARWVLAPVALALIAAVVDLASARVAPAAPLGFQTGWAPALTSRTAFPAVNNLLIRVMPDADGQAFYAERGLPIAQVQPFAVPPRNDDFVHADPARADAQAWIAAHGTATFVAWLARDPGARAGELWRARGLFVAPDVHRYMPAGWIGADDDHPVLQVARRLTANRWALLGMLLLAPLALYRPRADPRAGLALSLLVGGLVAAVGSYYGDALEPDRHCYGAAQLIAIALVIALLSAADRLLDRGATRPAPA